MASAAVFGPTGLVGSHILNVLIADSTFASIKTISRRAPKVTSPKLEAIVDGDSQTWTSKLKAITPLPPIVFSALGTTKAQAGSIQAQWKVDHDLNVEIAQAAKDAGISTYVFISSGGTRGFPGSMVPYSKMKVGVEDAIKGMGFEHAIILRPKALLGEREVQKSAFVDNVMGNLHKVSQGLEDLFAVHGVEVGRAAVTAAKLAGEGKAPSRYWVIENDEVIKMGRTDWQV